MMVSISPEFPAVYLLVFPGVQSASALLRAGWGCNTKHKATPRSTAARRGDQPSPSARRSQPKVGPAPAPAHLPIVRTWDQGQCRY